MKQWKSIFLALSIPATLVHSLFDSVHLKNKVLRGSSEQVEETLAKRDLLDAKTYSAGAGHRELQENENTSNLFSTNKTKFNFTAYVEQINAELADLYDVHELDVVVLQEEDSNLIVSSSVDNTALLGNVTILDLSVPERQATRVGTATIKVCQKKISDGKNCTSRDPTHSSVTTMESYMEEFSAYSESFEQKKPTPSNRELVTYPVVDAYMTTMNYFQKSVDFLNFKVTLQHALDALNQSLLGTLCFGPFWQNLATTMKVSTATSATLCGWDGFFSGAVTLEWGWDAYRYEVTWIVQTSNVNYADGNSLNVKYYSEGPYGADVDDDSLGYIARGSVESSWEELGPWWGGGNGWLTEIEIYIKDLDDVCVNEMRFWESEVGEISLSAAAFSYLTDTPLSYGYCIYFGDAEGAIANFKLNWQSAFVCHQNFGLHFNGDYLRCLRYAVISYDKSEGGKIVRYKYPDYKRDLPITLSDPYRPIKHNANRGLCLDVQNYQTENFTPINLINCGQFNKAQRFDIDSEGRIRSFLNPMKCIEAGVAGVLYAKLYLYDCHNGGWQRWRFLSDGRIQNLYHYKYISLAYCSVNHGTPVELRGYETGSCEQAQKWSPQY